MSLATKNCPVSLPSLSKLTDSFPKNMFPTFTDVMRREPLPGLPEIHFEHNKLQRPSYSFYDQNYPKNTDKDILEYPRSHITPEPVDSNQHHIFHHERSLSPMDGNRRSSAPTLQQEGISSSDRILLEKRKRNANASARFRDRRKQRERELQEKYRALEKRNKQFEDALRRIDPNHPLIADHDSDSMPSSNDTLFQRVDQLESLMHSFHKEKETSAQRLKELEEENKYLKSLIVPITHHSL